VELEGKRLLLSGATGGIGRAIAADLAGAGARLVLSSRSEEPLRELARSLPGGGRRHRVIVTDLSDAGAPDRLAAEAGDLDGMVANAALQAGGRLESFTSEQAARALRVNLEAPVLMARALVPALVKKGEGHLVFIASMSGKAASPLSSLYNASKFGLRGFAFGLRQDLHADGIGVSLVSPGFVREAGMFAQTGAKPPALMGSTTPKRVAEAVVRAITTNRSEIAVAPRRARFLTEIGHRHPELAARVQRSGAAAEIAERLAETHAAKR
jgi:short-subunit dehydrogenase